METRYVAFALAALSVLLLAGCMQNGQQSGTPTEVPQASVAPAAQATAAPSLNEGDISPAAGEPSEGMISQASIVPQDDSSLAATPIPGATATPAPATVAGGNSKLDAFSDSDFVPGSDSSEAGISTSDLADSGA